MELRNNVRAKLYIAGTGDEPTPHDELNAPERFSWLEIPNVGTIGATGIEQAFVAYQRWDGIAVQTKAAAVGLDAEIRCLDTVDDGLAAARKAAHPLDPSSYALKIEWPSGLTEFNLARLRSPRVTKGRNEDFVEAVFNLSLVTDRLLVQYQDFNVTEGQFLVEGQPFRVRV